MKKMYIGNSDLPMFIKNKIYDVISVEHEWYKIEDGTGEANLYPPHLFVDFENEKAWYKENDNLDALSINKFRNLDQETRELLIKEEEEKLLKNHMVYEK